MISFPVRAALRAALVLCLGQLWAYQIQGQEQKKLLTVERIYSQPSLDGTLNQGVQWEPDGKAVSYFERHQAGKESVAELWSMDAATGQRSMLVSADKLKSVFPEKKQPRSQATGMGRHPAPPYRWAPNGGAILFVGPDTLSWFDLHSQTAKILLQGKEAIGDVKISPDGRFVSFVREHNLFVVSVGTGKESAVTRGGTEGIREGELDWVYPEELDLRTAYWWSPDSSKIAYLEMDERKVNRYPLLNFESFQGEAQEERYPVAGGDNPVVHVFVTGVNASKPVQMDTGAETNQYVPRLEWLADSRRVAIERLNRAQTQLDLLFADATTGKSSVALTEKDAYWINVSDDLHFLEDGKRFLWSSERSGYRHLYLYGLDGRELAQLTRGEWEVAALQHVDEQKGIAYFIATEKSPLERHLYRVNLDGSGFARITQQEGTHRVEISPQADFFLDTYSNAMTPPQQLLSKMGGSTIALNENKDAELATYQLSPLEFLKVRTHDGVEMNAWVIKPANFDPAKKYPVLVYTYGGPHAQVVLNAWGGANFLWHQLMAEKGFVIFALDNRGSAGRGHLFEEPIHFRFGAQEMSDQRDGVAWLKGQPWVDATRIGIWGWSYGGHMTLHAVFEDPEEFKAGFAGGPVTDWHYYDTIYTERYLGLLPQNEESYQESSPIEKAGHLRGKLLIAHGTEDDNVHFANTLALVDKLITSGKSVEVIPLPGRGHGASDAAARIFLMNRVTQFFVTNLASPAESNATTAR